MIALGNEHGDIVFHTDFSGGQLGCHSAGTANSSGAAGDGAQVVVDGFYAGNQLCVWIGTRVGIEKTFDISENNEQVCMA